MHVCYTQTSKERAKGLSHQRGQQVLEHKYNTRNGEIDFVVKDNDTSLFVEAGYHQDNDIVGPLNSIDQRKQGKLTRTAQCYLQQHKQHALVPAEFNVVAITEQDTQHHIQWIKNAF